MSKSRQEINRRAAAARRIVLRRLADERPKVYDRWLREAYQQLDEVSAPLAPSAPPHD